MASVLVGSVLLAAPRAPAQSGNGVVRDGTLGPSAAVQPSGPNYLITPGMGEQRGANLFHSFERFSLRHDTAAGAESAHFQGGTGIENILARVTGGFESDIDGTLGADANLFLMNPAGIVFGANAKLDVKGSFHATTADSLRLGEGGHFEANPARPSVLSAAPPAAFGVLGAGTGAGTSLSVTGATLAVPAGETLSLVGRDRVGLTSAQLDAPGGRVNLA
ncbi:MAG: filamentous hemagglutinin N-terminal domain-containing protein, partial [Proteobacteria bacterium]|nr:filamentous hemagglutinin N-terminal domain-containing protein [Pseudomonadota bacterium]